MSEREAGHVGGSRREGNKALKQSEAQVNTDKIYVHFSKIYC